MENEEITIHSIIDEIEELAYKALNHLAYLESQLPFIPDSDDMYKSRHSLKLSIEDAQKEINHMFDIARELDDDHLNLTEEILELRDNKL